MRGLQSRDGQVVGGGAALLGPSTSWLRRARRRARGWVRSRFKGWAPWLGYVYLALALACVVEEPAALGAVGLVLGVPVTWVCGLWVVPRSEDAYVLAVSNMLQDWGVEVELAQRRHVAENREMTAFIDAKQAASREFLDALRREQVGLAEITPPPALREFHNAYLQLCGRYSDAVTACYEAIEDKRKNSVQETAQEVCDLWHARQDYSRAMADKLRECFGDSA
jgi:hypothetical protein